MRRLGQSKQLWKKKKEGTSVVSEKIHDQVKTLKERISKANDEYKDLERYLSSSKFHTDTTVLVSDVLRRLAQLKSILND